MQKEFVQVAVELPLEAAFTYRVPEELKPDIASGKRVLVPFGNRTVTGYALSFTSTPPDGVSGIKPVIDILDTVPLFDEKRLRFLKWVSSYYFAPLGEVLALLTPGSASVKSARTVKALESADGRAPKRQLDQDILEAARKGATVSALLKRFRGKPVYSAIERLKREGFAAEESGLRGGGTKKTERFVSIDLNASPPVFKNSPSQQKVYSYLKEAAAEVPMGVLVSDLGEVRDAVTRLHEKGLLKIEERQVLRDPLSEIAPREARFTPNAEQETAITAISKALRTGGFSPFLLYGVTGSGKTLVYLKALEEAVRLEKKAIILTPEIALTPWPAAYLRALFPGRVALVHSGLSEGERLDEWGRVLNGEADIIVGARSALFSPIKGLGLIIVDEEHESSYKQEDGVRYNARDAALVLAKELGITVVLGSATPSIETFQNAKTGKITPLTIKNRVDGRGLPQVEILDMKGVKETVSQTLSELLKDTLAAQKQAILFLNRRGFSSCLICRDCGYSFTCLNCSVTLTMHKGRRKLVCHYCDLTAELPDTCPSCKGVNLITPGTGTEKVEEEMQRLFPDARTGRLDRDTASAKGAAKRIIDDVEKRNVDILIGTQMVSKGHHFPGVTLVGVISGDTSLNIPDFRSSERTFQLITQAAGRAGRGSDPGKVVIQTLNPAHYCLEAAAAHDYDSFFEQELELRRELSYPPFTKLAALRIEGAKEERVISGISTLKSDCDRFISARGLDVRVLGPAPALVSKIKNRFRWQVLLKCADIKTLHSLVNTLKNRFESRNAGGISLSIDIDPLTTV